MATKTKNEAEAKSKARRASLDDLINKAPLTKTVTIFSGDEPLEIVVRSVGRKVYADLVEACTITEKRPVVDDEGKEVEDKTEEVETLDETEFFPKLIAASATDPEIPLDVVKKFADEWNATEFDELAMAAWEVNTRHKVSAQGNG